MRILLIHRYFWPDAPPYGSMLRRIGARLVDEGHDVDVLSAHPGYVVETRGLAASGDEHLDGMDVQRVRLLDESQRGIARVVNVVAFALRVFWRVTRGQHQMVMFATMPPIVLGLAVRAALALRRRAGAYVYHCQDIQPESAGVAALLPSGLRYRLLRRLDTATCRRAAAVVVLSDDMRDTMLVRGVDAQRVHVINNFAHVEPAGDRPCDVDADLPSRVTGEVVVAFAGNLGRYQQLDQVVAAAHELRDDPVQFWFIGDGVARELLERRAGDLVGDRVHFLGYRPPTTAFAILQHADLAVVSLRRGMYRVAYPSKTMTCLMAGCRLALLVEADSELARTVAANHLGFVASQEDVGSFVAQLRGYAQGVPRTDRGAAVAFAQRHFASQQVLTRWMTLFHQLSTTTPAVVQAGPRRPPGCDAGPTMAQAAVKRAFDLVVGAIALATISPILAVLVLIAAFQTGTSGLFRQVRVGRGGRPFTILKIRTMDPHVEHGTQIAVADDPRVTRSGRLMRRLRVDELPQLWNILRGHMSFVGPRPEVPGFHDLDRDDDRVALSVRPGMTGPATLRFRDEARLLATRDDPDAYYQSTIFPAKVRADRAYVEQFSLGSDLSYLAQTLAIVLARRPADGASVGGRRPDPVSDRVG